MCKFAYIQFIHTSKLCLVRAKRTYWLYLSVLQHCQCVRSYTYVHAYAHLYAYNCIQEQKQQQEWGAQGNKKAAATEICAGGARYSCRPIEHMLDRSTWLTYLAKEAHPLVGFTSIGVKKAIRYIRALVLGFCGHFSWLYLSFGSCRTNFFWGFLLLVALLYWTHTNYLHSAILNL